MGELSNSAGQIVTANDLLSGDVIYATAGCKWSRDINDALILHDERSIASTLEHAQHQTLQIVDPYLIFVEFGAYKSVTPIHYREQIRVNGPNADLPETPIQSGYEVMGC